MPDTGTAIPSGGPAEASAPTEAAHSPWSELEDHLEAARRSILAEIRNYPAPIAACDQQFNHLLEQRDRIAEALSRLASMRLASSAPTEADVKVLMEFIKASGGIAHELKPQLVQFLYRRTGEPA